jgi:hypothetical protein
MTQVLIIINNRFWSARKDWENVTEFQCLYPKINGDPAIKQTLDGFPITCKLLPINIILL